jgi:hypothetical protein
MKGTYCRKIKIIDRFFARPVAGLTIFSGKLYTLGVFGRFIFEP